MMCEIQLLTFANHVSNSYTSYKNIVRIAWPIMIGSLAINIINLTDTSFLGRVGEVELGASALAGVFYFVVVIIGWAFNTGMQIIVARRSGENRIEEIGKVVDHELMLLMILSVVQFAVLHFLSPLILDALVSDDQVRQAANAFLYWRSFGIFFGMFNSCCQAFFVGIGKTKVINLTTGIMAAGNLLFAWVLIFGHLSFPALGIAGSGMASTMAEALATIVYIIFIVIRGYKSKYRLWQFASVQIQQFKSLFKLSSPIVVQQLMSIATWFLFFLFIEHMGQRNLAISNLVRGVYMLCGIPTWALGSTANSMVSNLIGQGKEKNVLHLIWKIIKGNFVLNTVIALLLVIFPSALLGIFTSDVSLIHDAISSLYVIAPTVLLFSCSFIIIYSVTGTGSSRFALKMETVCIGLYILYASVVVYHYHAPLPVLWCAEGLYWLIAILIGGTFLRYGKWKKDV